jgi:hypothetical protein
MSSFLVRRSDVWIPAAIAVVALLGAVGIQIYAPGGAEIRDRPSGADGPELTEADAREQERQLATNLELLKRSPGFGFDNLLADWTFLNFLQYFGDEQARELTGYQLNDDHFDVISKFDPKWVDMYLFLSTSVAYYQGEPELSVKLMNRGTDALSPDYPDAWRLWRLKAIDQLLLVGDTEAAIASLEMAAKWAAGTPSEALAARFREAAAILRENPDNKMIRINAWLTVYSQTTDPVVRKRAIAELEALGVQIEQGEDGQLRFFVPPEETEEINR